MAKRLFDLAFSLVALLMTLPVVALACLLIWAEDGHSPIYRGVRVGLNGKDFGMIKLRTMVPNGERFGGNSTASSDQRLTKLGRTLRRYKLDELPQFWNVLLGDMSVVGPRPNFRAGGVDRYTPTERQLLTVRPGITDLASIVFSDEGPILDGSADPDGAYEVLIRPWKSRLGLLYVQRRNLVLDLALIGLTAASLVSRRMALKGVAAILDRWNASDRLRDVCSRTGPLPSGSPPGQVT